MAFFNDSNRKRVEKICEIMDLIERSGASNGATKEECAGMIHQIMERTERYRGIAPTSAPENAQIEVQAQPRRIGVAAPQWVSVLDMARECSLSELQGAMAVYLNRLDEHFDDLKYSGERELPPRANRPN